jgi:hypothetical protein
MMLQQQECPVVQQAAGCAAGTVAWRSGAASNFVSGGFVGFIAASPFTEVDA